VAKIIEVLPKLKQKIGAFKFLVMGEGSEAANLKSEIKKMGLGNEVIFLGKITHMETYNYLKSAAVFILNSQYEGASHALLDVMSLGLPILASNAGGNPELIQDKISGFLFEYNNGEEILLNLEKLLTEKETREKISLAAQNKSKEFNWNNVIEKTLAVIKNI
jgi:glycosyltransferase involved in cell wall biosynthesis